MKDYNIYAGSLDSPSYRGTLKNVLESKALDLAYTMACEDYEQYSGLHGLLNWEDFIENNPDANEADFEDALQEEMENTIDYYVIPTDEDTDVNKDEINYL